jgi:hypothetical protein
MHISLMFPSEYLCAADLQGKDYTLEIAALEQKDLRMDDGSMEPKWILSFKGAEKKMVLNKTNTKLAASILGNETDEWINQSITVFPTTCSAFGETVECIRVRGKKGGGLR